MTKQQQASGGPSGSPRQQELERLRKDNARLRALLGRRNAPPAEGPETELAGTWQRMLETSSDGFFFKDATGRLMWSNASLGRFPGILQKEEGTEGEGCLSPVLERDDDRVMAGETVECRVELPGGEKGLRLLLRKEPYRSADGEVAGILGSVRDVSRLAELERLLAVKEEWYDQLIDKALGGIFRSTPGGRLLYVNPAFAEMMGYSSSQAMLDSVRDIATQLYWNPGDRLRYLEQIRNSERNEGIETCFRRADGMPIWVFIRAYLVHDDLRREQVIQGTVMDVTSSRLAMEEMRRAKETAEAAHETQSRFLANMSHEFRTPLNGALGMLQLLEDSDLSREQLGFVSNAVACCENLTRLVGDVLDLCRVEAGTIMLDEMVFNPREMLADIVNTFIDKVAQAKVFVCMEVDDRLPELVLGDRVRFRQILFNLVGNAMKYTEQGRVTVNMSPLPAHARAGSSHRILCTVSDTGEGIPMDRLERLLEPFVQGDGSFTRKGDGLGLGLHIVRKLVSAMGGAMSIVSEEAQGSCVYLSLPFGKAHPVDESTSMAAILNGREIGLSMRSILVVEDDKVNQLAMKRFLEKLGIRTTCVPDGLAALEAVEKESFDCILMDIHMPVLDGVEATRRIRNMESMQGRKPLRIIALTACTLSGDKERMLAAGIDGYLSKPVDFGRLVTTLSSFQGMESVV